MLRHTPHDHATSNVLAWSHHAANVEPAAEDEASADADEPPDAYAARPKMTSDFRRTSVPTKPKESHASLLTRALQSADESTTSPPPSRRDTTWRRRPSLTSNISLASTTDLTSDTGLSTPARTNSPSPRLRNNGFTPLILDKHPGAHAVQIVGSLPRRDVAPYPVRKSGPQPRPAVTTEAKAPAVQPTEKKRCISFACVAKPTSDAAKIAAPVPPPAPAGSAKTASVATTQSAQIKKPCIKFACPAQPPRQSLQQTPPNRERLERLAIPKNEESGSVSTVVSTPATVRKARSPAARRPRPMTPRRIPLSPARQQRRNKYITASSDELQGEEYHFHAFASDHLSQDDWIREEGSLCKGKLLIDDLLKKERDFRRLVKEAEEEAEQEDAEDDEDDAENADEDEDEDEEINVEDEEEEELEENADDDDDFDHGSDDFSDGYNTDEDLGFADSDDDEDDDLCLWTLTASPSYMARICEATPVFRPSSYDGMSDSSICSRKVNVVRTKRTRQLSMVARAVTPELPDSTDFVCGTMDEDRPLEEAYATRLAARKLEKLRAIPQDIDPSFPTSDREDEDDEDDGVHHSHDGSGEPLWLHGELEELHDERTGRRQRKSDVSPKRHRSPPPPKRYHSPPPQVRGRSPRRLFDHTSPKRMKSPAPAAYAKSPTGTPTHPGPGHALAFKSLAARPGLTHTKSLPRASYFPAHIKRSKGGKDKAHVRGAIDIVKGLEEKRKRRKEKFHQKYCDRARKGQVPEKKKARLGEGAERMRELGLLSAGKRNYVISV